MTNLPAYRVKELSQFFTAMTGRSAADVSSSEMYDLMCRLESPFAFKQKLRYRLTGFARDCVTTLESYLHRKPQATGEGEPL